MIFPHERTPEWESPDAAALRAFLATPTGEKVFAMLKSGFPSLKGGRMETTALQAKLVEGYQLALTNFSALAAPLQQPETRLQESPYPALDDDARWEGPKLSEINVEPT